MKQLFARFGGAIIVAAALAACSGQQTVTPPTGLSPNHVSQAPAMSIRQPEVLHITQAAREMAAHMKIMTPHFMPLRTHNPFATASRPSAVGYPLDLVCNPTYAKYKCPTMASSTAYNIYVSLDGKKCMNEKCWGNPQEFLQGLAGSAFAGLVTQYTKGPASGYTYGGSFSVPYTTLKYNQYAPTFYGNDLGTILAQAVLKNGGKIGLNTEYHIFLPPGADTCFDQSNACYSPDNLNSFVFCAYHTAAYISALKNYVIFSVEPYQNATVKVGSQTLYACQNSTVPKGTNRLNSGTASTLGHESFESWTDPLPPLSWINPWSGGSEIGDICAYQFMFQGKFGKAGMLYLQQMYSDKVHGCNNS